MQPMELDVVRLLISVPDSGLEAGATGTVVAAYDDGNCEVEFIDEQGATIALLALPHSALELTWKYPWPGRVTS